MRRRLLSNLSALASNAVLPPATTLFARSPMRLLWTPAGAPPPRPRWATANARARPTAPAAAHQARRSVCASAARRADAASADAPPPAPSDLRSVPGVGAKTELLLQASGIGCVADLSRVYYGEAAASTKAMVSYLQDEVGIRRGDYATKIAAHVATLPEPDADADAAPPPPPSADRRVTLCVEGNISAGKSSFLRFLADECVELQDVVEVVPEPVDKWRAVGGPSGANVLEQFYADPARYAYTFQNYVFVTRMMQERESAGGASPLRLLERSVFSDRMVFVRAVHEARWMSDMELDIYDSWFDPVVSALPALAPDGFIYLRATPATCHARMHKRARAEELRAAAGRDDGAAGGLPLNYLEGLHAKHDAWLADPGLLASRVLRSNGRGGAGPKGVLTTSTLFPAAGSAAFGAGPGARPPPPPPGLLDLGTRVAMARPDPAADVPEPSEIAGQVYFLDAARQTGLHAACDGVPALVLDADADIDLARDAAAKSHYARQVRAYFEYVRAVRARREAADPARAVAGRAARAGVVPADAATLARVLGGLPQGRPPAPGDWERAARAARL